MANVTILNVFGIKIAEKDHYAWQNEYYLLYLPRN